MESLPAFGNSYVPSFFQYAFPGKYASLAVAGADILQKAHQAAKSQSLPESLKTLLVKWKPLS